MNHKTEPTPQDVESHLRAVAKGIGTYRRFVINDTDVLIASGPEIARYSFAARVGSGILTARQQGFPSETAHITEHLAFRHLLPSPRDAFSNACVTSGATSFHIKMHNNEAAENFLGYCTSSLSALSGNAPDFGNEDSFQKEKRRIILERGSRPDGIRVQRMANISGLVGMDPQSIQDYVRPLASAKAVTFDHVIAYRQANYTKQNTVVVLAAPLPEDVLVAACEKNLHLPDGSAGTQGASRNKQGQLFVHQMDDDGSDISVSFECSPTNQSSLTDIPSFLACVAQDILQERLHSALMRGGHVYGTYFGDRGAVGPFRESSFYCSAFTDTDPFPFIKAFAGTIKGYIDHFGVDDAAAVKQAASDKLMKRGQYEIEACDYWLTQKRPPPRAENLVQEIRTASAEEIKERLSSVFTGFMAFNVSTPQAKKVPAYEEIRAMIAPERPRQTAARPLPPKRSY